MFDNENNNSEEEHFLPGMDKRNSFVVPEGYFEMLSNRIIAKIEIVEELSEFELLSELKNKPAYAVPADYFKASENTLEYQYELSEFEALAKIGKPVLKEMDAEYFGALDRKVLQKMEVAEEVSEYKLLASLEKQNNFAVNAAYFETVADRVKEKYYAGNSQQSVFSRVLAYILKPKIAFAYSVILLIGVGAFYYKHNQAIIVTPDTGDCKTLACLEKREVLNEKTMKEFNDDNLYEMVDVDALDKQLSDSTAVTDSVSVKSEDSIKKNN